MSVAAVASTRTAAAAVVSVVVAAAATRASAAAAVSVVVAAAATRAAAVAAVSVVAAAASGLLMDFGGYRESPICLFCFSFLFLNEDVADSAHSDYHDGDGRVSFQRV